ncbi:hypothetical protein FA95DRAFT_1601318 [Auriscalpium vulgare]|uniref:Uncharacterized protein n=1 Tax=Auriscalpium vulgare TaxID=40419 RepID=A0ACB8S989_9AGAM|nr:hypothetical protein FA95DRAFT_1601318 [Auriscalpium vulgare]
MTREQGAGPRLSQGKVPVRRRSASQRGGTASARALFPNSQRNLRPRSDAYESQRALSAERHPSMWAPVTPISHAEALDAGAAYDTGVDPA